MCHGRLDHYRRKTVAPFDARGRVVQWKNTKRGYFRLPRLPRLPPTIRVEGLLASYRGGMGHGVEWADIDMGIDADSLYRLDREQSGEAMPVEEFDAWMSRNGLSLTEAAKALGLSRRTIIYYHGGHKPIPTYIGMACKGWEAIKAENRAA